MASKKEMENNAKMERWIVAQLQTIRMAYGIEGTGHWEPGSTPIYVLELKSTPKAKTTYTIQFSESEI